MAIIGQQLLFRVWLLFSYGINLIDRMYVHVCLRNISE